MSRSTTPATATAELPDLSRTELDVMKVLWRSGRQSAREIHESLPASLGWAYSTTRTVVERLVDKGWVEKGSFHGMNVYRAGISKPRGLARLVWDFARRVMETDTAPVVNLFAESEALTPEEVEELEGLLAEAEDFEAAEFEAAEFKADEEAGR